MFVYPRQFLWRICYRFALLLLVFHLHVISFRFILFYCVSCCVTKIRIKFAALNTKFIIVISYTLACSYQTTHMHSTIGIEMADFSKSEIIFGVVSLESYLDLDAHDLEFGFNETRRDRIVRTYVRNNFNYHLNEIYAALKV